MAIDMHGSGSTMLSYFIEGEHDIEPSLFINALGKSNLTVDLLDWNSCYMGTIGNIYSLMSSTKTKYAVVSSNIGADQQTEMRFIPYKGKTQWVDGSKGHHPMADVLGADPKQSAALLVRKVGVNKDAQFTHNSMAVDGIFFRGQIEPLMDKWRFALKESGIKIPLEETKDGYPAAWFTKYLNKIIQSQEAADTLKEQSLNLSKEINKSIFSYGCWDYSLKRYYDNITNVSAKGECIGGFSVDNASIDILFVPTWKSLRRFYNTAANAGNSKKTDSHPKNKADKSIIKDFKKDLNLFQNKYKKISIKSDL